MKQLKIGTQVKLTDERIQQLDSRSATRYRERVGAVVGCRTGAKGRLVEFDADEGRLTLARGKEPTLPAAVRCGVPGKFGMRNE